MSDENSKLRSVTLDEPIQRGDTTIDKVQIRKPQSGELRGLSLVELGQLNVDALSKILPRITIPTLTPQEVSALDPADLLAMGGIVGRFLLQKWRLTDAPDQ
ncbi:phage tail assembly protein [Sphingomonas cavernae]|uniref:Phage tail assembly protein n=1 Tax=Sphingomonas cavernae TaxID=2320861 RepID=A0A418WP35_9SPHN|nr:phage tail assembly protein [Sphingomonas cavernae]RJF92994.1 phage tail assembly protein [Sphingomonas cavernae]